MITLGQWPLPPAGERALIAAVGQSGVGKTTTLAKLATLTKASGRMVALVTCDTFRVGGIEQLRRYATLLDVSFDTAKTAEELENIVDHSDADVVIVDTSGRPPRANSAELLLAEPRFGQSDACGPFARHVLLCVPGACREVDLQGSYKAFCVTTPTALAMTKLDETSLPSGIVHAALATRLPVALTCAGPRVPEDIEPADVERLVDLLAPHVESRKARAA
jgi:flagellar biosynthesis protein FlhF